MAVGCGNRDFSSALYLDETFSNVCMAPGQWRVGMDDPHRSRYFRS